jgi:hypothetical protein
MRNTTLSKNVVDTPLVRQDSSGQSQEMIGTAPSR